MNPDVYPFTVGDFRCLAVSDGTMRYAPPNFPPPAIFLCANAPQDQLTNPQNVHAAEIIKWTEWKSTYNCLVIDTGKLKVLVDTGADGLAPTTGKLISHLQA
ncbi:MAG TPA: hypothetical protein VHT73_16240, partial [Thermodesulfobacteriota bacterium]|nr:hypothetical protein [Thermodesulfobacteriota bacterium]